MLQGDVEDGRAQEEPERASAGGLAAGGREEVEGQSQGGGPVAGGREEGAGWRSRSRSRVWEAEDWRRDRVGKSPAFLEKRAASRVSIRGPIFLALAFQISRLVIKTFGEIILLFPLII